MFQLIVSLCHSSIFRWLSSTVMIVYKESHFCCADLSRDIRYDLVVAQRQENPSQSILCQTNFQFHFVGRLSQITFLWMNTCEMSPENDGMSQWFDSIARTHRELISGDSTNPIDRKYDRSIRRVDSQLMAQSCSTCFFLIKPSKQRMWSCLSSLLSPLIDDQSSAPLWLLVLEERNHWWAKMITVGQKLLR